QSPSRAGVDQAPVEGHAVEELGMLDAGTRLGAVRAGRRRARLGDCHLGQVNRTGVAGGGLVDAWGRQLPPRRWSATCWAARRWRSASGRLSTPLITKDRKTPGIVLTPHSNTTAVTTPNSSTRR